MRAANTLEFIRARDLDHGNPGSDINEEVRVHVGSGLGKLHGLCVGIVVGKYFVGDFGDKEVEAWMKIISDCPLKSTLRQ